MQPLRIKASGTPITSANFQGLQEMTDGEINQYLSYVITNKFATDTDGTGTAELNVDTSNALTGTSIGTWTNTIRNDAIGTHPTAGATTDTTYYFKQVTAAASESITNRPVGWDSSIKEFNDSAIDTDVLDKVIEDMVTSTGYTVGQYSLAASAPAGGTWTSRATITDSNQGGSTNLYLWQKTAPTTSANSDLSSLKLEGTNVKMMTVAEIEQMVPNFRNRIIDSGVGTYKLQASAPAGGTWVQMGDSLVDTRQQVASENYAGTYTGNFTGNYTGYYSNTFAGTYTGSYANTFAGTYSGSYANTFSGNYVGNYVGYYDGPKAYTGSYVGSFSGTYASNFVGTGTYVGGSSDGPYTGYYVAYYINQRTLYYSGYAAYFASFAEDYFVGYYTGFYTGFYTGPATYTGYFTGAYNQNFTGYYVGTSAYAGTYSGTYTGYYSNTFSGNYVGSYANNFAGTYSGSYANTFAGTYSGSYANNFTGNYAGDTIQASTENVSTVKLWLRSA